MKHFSIPVHRTVNIHTTVLILLPGPAAARQWWRSAAQMSGLLSLPGPLPLRRVCDIRGFCPLAHHARVRALLRHALATLRTATQYCGGQGGHSEEDGRRGAQRSTARPASAGAHQDQVSTPSGADATGAQWAECGTAQQAGYFQQEARGAAARVCKQGGKNQVPYIVFYLR